MQSRQAGEEEEIVQAGKEEVKVRREGVRSRTSRKCRERHGRCRGQTGTIFGAIFAWSVMITKSVCGS